MAADEHQHDLQAELAHGLTQLDQLNLAQVAELQALLPGAHGPYSAPYFSAETALRERTAALNQQAVTPS